jgi:cytochrome c biogenesis protein CcdA
MNELEKDENIKVTKFNTQKDNCQNAQISYAKAYGVAEQDYLIVPTLYVGNKSFIMDSDSKRNEVKQLIDGYANQTIKYEPIKINNLSCSVQDVFNDVIKNNSFWGILLAGLIDGINPCAISILLLFCSFMVFSNKRKQIIISAICFIFGIFIANFTYGLGISFFYNILAGNVAVITGLYSIAILMCVVAIVLNTHDIFVQIKNVGEIKNQLPTSWKYKMTEIAKKSVFSKFMIPATFASGFLIGVIELACTGQIYYPTITYMINNHSLNPYYMFLLVCYNIMFILPLVVIAILGMALKDPEKIKSKILKKTYIIKSVANIFFIVILVLLIKELISFI